MGGAHDQEILALWYRGLNDREIAREIGVSSESVRVVRRRMDLEPNGFEIRESAPGARMRLYEQGCTDAEIARREGIGYSTVYQWRIENGLPSNSVYVRDEIGAPDPTRYALWSKGMTDPEIGKIVGIKPAGMARWRKKHGLLSNNRRREKDGA